MTATETAGAARNADRWFRTGGVNQWHWSNWFALADGDASLSGGSYTAHSGESLSGTALAD